MEKQGCRFTVLQILRSTPLPATASNTTTGMPSTSQELWLRYSVGLANSMPSCLHTVGRCFFLLRASPVFNSYLSREHLALTEVHPEALFWYCSWGQAWIMQPHSWPRGITGRNTFLLWFSSALLEGTALAWSRWLTCPQQKVEYLQPVFSWIATLWCIDLTPVPTD